MEAAETAEIRVGGKVIQDARPGEGRVADPARLRARTKGWQVANIQEYVEKWNGGPVTDNRYARCVVNVYQPGQSDEMHCHPGSEHIFMVVEGELHITGINEGEDLILKPGELVHMNQSYFHRLDNPTDQVTVFFQVATKPPKPARVRQYNYRGPADTIDPTLLEGA